MLGDTDIGLTLVSFEPSEKHRENKVADSLYNTGEYVYRDLDSNNIVSIYDYRLTWVGWIPFHCGYMLDIQDVEYSFERAMVQDRRGGPTWMFYEPLLNTWGAEGLGDLTNPSNVIKIGKMIDHAVESNSTHVWFNLAFPGAYAPFLQILSQSWSSILSKQWINDLITA